jgi:hypothetical protein
MVSVGPPLYWSPEESRWAGVSERSVPAEKLQLPSSSRLYPRSVRPVVKWQSVPVTGSVTMVAPISSVPRLLMFAPNSAVLSVRVLLVMVAVAEG